MRLFIKNHYQHFSFAKCRATAVIIITLQCFLAGKPASSDFADNIRIRYHGELHAPKPTLLWNLFSLGYELGQDFQIETQLQGYLDFSNKINWTIGNPRFGLSGRLLSGTDLVLWTDLNIEFPLNKAARAAGLGVAPGSYQEINYHIPHSRIVIGVQHWIRFYLYSTNLPWLDVYANISPMIAYKLSPALSVQNRISINYFHIRGRGWRQMSENDVAWEPGLNWHPSPGLSFEPYLSIQPHKKNSSNSTWLGLWIDFSV